MNSEYHRTRPTKSRSHELNIHIVEMCDKSGLYILTIKPNFLLLPKTRLIRYICLHEKKEVWKV